MKHKLTYTDNYILVVDNSEIKVGDWFYLYDAHLLTRYIDAKPVKEAIKVIAHLPLGSTVLEGVTLLPPLEVEVDALCPYPESMQNAVDWHNGYNKAKEKYKFAQEDIENAWKMGYRGDTIDECIESISQPKMPTHFECETEWVNSYGSPTFQYDVQELNPKTTTNSQGQTEWKGKWIYDGN